MFRIITRPKSLKIHCRLGITDSSQPRPKAARVTNKVKPTITPSM
jgi:hypothetical protein